MNATATLRIPDARNLAAQFGTNGDMDTDTGFREFHAELIGLTLEQHRRYLHVEPCDCTHPDCIGWATIPMDRWKREQAEARRQELLARTHIVYFAELGGLIKIGISDDPERRARHLNAVLLGTCPGSRKIERELHDEFADLRERGEWFRAEPRLLRRIEALTS